MDQDQKAHIKDSAVVGIFYLMLSALYALELAGLQNLLEPVIVYILKPFLDPQIDFWTAFALWWVLMGSFIIYSTAWAFHEILAPTKGRPA